jgi:hypothetical protein
MANARYSLRLPPLRKKSRDLLWKYSSYAELIKVLGHGDGMAECIEVAVRDFTHAAHASGDPQAFLKSNAQQHGVVEYEFAVDNIPIRAAHLYIVGAYQQLESFLYGFAEETAQVLHTQHRHRKEGECPLDWVLAILPGGLQTNIERVWQERYLLLEYYRHVRNAFVHPRIDRRIVARSYADVAIFREPVRKDFGLDAPNRTESLKLDDFLLFTRLIKYLGTDLCRIAIPAGTQVKHHALGLLRDGDMALRRLPFRLKAIRQETARKTGFEIERAHPKSRDPIARIGSVG